MKPPHSAWAMEENKNGTVMGNVTMTSQKMRRNKLGHLKM